MLSSVINDVASKNSADLLRTIAVSNKLSLTSAKGSSFSFKNVTQTATVNTKVQAEFVNNISNKIQNDIANKVKDSIDMATKDFKKKVDKLVLDEKSSSSVEGVVGKVADTAKNFFDNVGKVLSLSIGNSVSSSNTSEMNKTLKDNFNLNQSFNHVKNNDANTAISNVLKSENLAKCAANSSIANEINLGVIDVTGPIEIENNKQEATVIDVMNCAFNQQILNDISSKVYNEYETLIKEMIENVSDTLNDQQKENQNL